MFTEADVKVLDDFGAAVDQSARFNGLSLGQVATLAKLLDGYNAVRKKCYEAVLAARANVAAATLIPVPKEEGGTTVPPPPAEPAAEEAAPTSGEPADASAPVAPPESTP